MKTKIRLLFLVGLFSIQSYAQEQFLKLDSIQVIYGTLNKIAHPGDSRFRTGIDTINIFTNSIIKLKSFLMEVELTDGQGQWASNYYSSYYNIKLNNRIVMFKTVSSSAENDKMRLEYFNLIENGQMNLFIEGTSYSSYTWANPFEFHYRVELHHYSYE